jgi:hypothetical protein
MPISTFAVAGNIYLRLGCVKVVAVRLNASIVYATHHTNFPKQQSEWHVEWFKPLQSHHSPIWNGFSNSFQRSAVTKNGYITTYNSETASAFLPDFSPCRRC